MKIKKLTFVILALSGITSCVGAFLYLKLSPKSFSATHLIKVSYDNNFDFLAIKKNHDKRITNSFYKGLNFSPIVVPHLFLMNEVSSLKEQKLLKLAGDEKEKSIQRVQELLKNNSIKISTRYLTTESYEVIVQSNSKSTLSLINEQFLYDLAKRSHKSIQEKILSNWEKVFEFDNTFVKYQLQELAYNLTSVGHLSDHLKRSCTDCVSLEDYNIKVEGYYPQIFKYTGDPTALSVSLNKYADQIQFNSDELRKKIKMDLEKVFIDEKTLFNISSIGAISQKNSGNIFKLFFVFGVYGFLFILAILGLRHGYIKFFKNENNKLVKDF